MCGVISSTISDLERLSLLVENRRPSSGRSPSPGILVTELRSSSWIRPASTWVSPLRRRSMVSTAREPIW
ncbi:hypothetical protein D3C85_1367850 [compost metagenome]